MATGYRNLTARHIGDVSIRDLGVVCADGYSLLRTIIIKGIAIETKREILAAVMLDKDGDSLVSPEHFSIDDAANHELACRHASDGADFPDSYRKLLISDCRTIAEQFVANEG